MPHVDEELRSVCPFCLRENDVVTELLDEGQPKPFPGALAMCFKCGMFAFFMEDLSLRKPTRHEQFDLDNDPGIAQARWAWKEVKKRQQE